MILSPMTLSEVKPIIVLGAGGHAKVLVSILKRLDRKIIGVTDRFPDLKADVLGVSIIGDDREIIEFKPDQIDLVNGVGMTKPGQSVRHQLAKEMRSLGFNFIQVIDPSAFIAPEAILEDGVQVMSTAVIQPGVIIRRDSIINSGAQVDHDSVVGEGSHLCPSSVLAGSVQVGKMTMIGTGSVIIPEVVVGDSQMVKAGMVVTKSML